MGKLLSASAIEQYERDGYHFPVRVMPPEAAQEYRRKLETFETENGPLTGNLRQKNHLLFTWADELIRHPTILDAVEDLLGPNILVWSSGFFIKEPRTEDYVSWHQDGTYWGLDSNDVVTAWVAFADSTPEKGCMRVVPGTHKAQLPHKDTFGEHNLLSRGQEIQVEVDERQARDLVLQAGEISLHHVLIAHGSGPNRSDDRRIGYAIRYIAPHVRQIVGSSDSAALVRGRDTHGYFEHEPRPSRDMAPEMVAYHKAVLDRQARVLYRDTDRRGFDDPRVHG